MTQQERFRLVRGEEVRDSSSKEDQANRLKALLQQPLPQELRNLESAASRYQLEDDLETAMNMALAVGAPLLLTGEPGTGKTQVAYFLAWYFGIEVFSFQVKSFSTATDLKYDFDAVAYLRYAQSGSDTKQDRTEFLQPRALWRAYESEQPAVLLIDEIDKAPRDFPNDLLHELDQHSFPHPFDDQTEIKCRAERPPIVVITSNAERRLPDAFLRRCIYHHIELNETFVRKVVDAHLGSFPNLGRELRERALECFLELRSKENLTKKPSTAELLTWLSVLAAMEATVEQLTPLHAGTPGLAALLKDAQDRKHLA